MSLTLTSWLAGACTTLRSNNLYNSSAKEILGANLPRMGLVSGPDERRDQAIGQFGSSAIHLGLGLATEQVLDKGVAWLVPSLIQKTSLSPQHIQVWHLGKSLGIASVLASALMALPHVRNTLSARETGQTDFAGVVGLRLEPESQEDIRRNIAHNWRSARHWLAGGLLTSAATVATFLAALQSGKTLPQTGVLGSVAKHLTLPGGRYSQMSDGWAVTAWGLPSFAGQWAAARGPVEKQEVGIGLAFWLLSFTVIPRQVEQMILRVAKDKPLTRFGGAETVAWLGQLASSLVLYTALPAMTSLFSRTQRLAHQEATQNVPSVESDSQKKHPAKPLSTSALQTATPQPTNFVASEAPTPVSLSPQPIQAPLLSVVVRTDPNV